MAGPCWDLCPALAAPQCCSHPSSRLTPPDPPAAPEGEHRAEMGHCSGFWTLLEGWDTQQLTKLSTSPPLLLLQPPLACLPSASLTENQPQRVSSTRKTKFLLSADLQTTMKVLKQSRQEGNGPVVSGEGGSEFASLFFPETPAWVVFPSPRTFSFGSPENSFGRWKGKKEDNTKEQMLSNRKGGRDFKTFYIYSPLLSPLKALQGFPEMSGQRHQDLLKGQRNRTGATFLKSFI